MTEGCESAKEQKAAMNIEFDTVKTENFSMDYFRFGQGEEPFVILPGLGVQSVIGFAESSFKSLHFNIRETLGLRNIA